MRTLRVCTPLLTAAAVLLLASPAWAQKMVKPAKGDLDRGPDVYRMEVYNGPMRTVHYVTPSYMSPSESASLRELERAENELALVDQMFNLRSQYALNEQALEAKRRTMQELLYGYNRDESSSYNIGASGPAFTGYGGFGGIVGGYPGMYGFAGSGWGGNWYGQAAAAGNTSHSLAVGVGMNEGAIKTAMAQNLLSPALSDSAALAYRNYRGALARLDESPRLRDGMGLPELKGGAASPAGFDANADVIYLKDGSKISGKIAKEEADWLTVETAGKRTEKVRTTEVTRISRGGDAKPASNKE
jgi:hypothetical protein